MANWEQLKEKGNDLFRSKQYSSAVNYYTQAIQLNSKENTLYSNRATCLKLLGKYKQAIKDFRLCLELSPKNTKNMKKLASVYIFLGNFGEAEILYQKCANLEPRDPSHKADLKTIKEKTQLLERIDEKKKANDWATVEEVAEKLLIESPECTHVKLVYIDALIENVKISKAIDFLSSKVTDEEKEINDEFEYNLIRCYYYNSEYPKAKLRLQSLMKKKMEEEKYTQLMTYIDNIEQLKTKANEVFKGGDYDQAINEYTQLLEYDPLNKVFNSVIYANRCLCYRKQKKLTEALKDAELSVKSNPFYVKGYLRRGHVYMDLKMYDEAKSNFETVKEMEPNNKEAESSLLQARKLAESARKRDYYEILGISKNATQDEIKKAYKKMALKWHPDRNAESEETKKIAQAKFIDIGDAYNVLSDPQKKQMYDSGMDPLNPENASSSGMNFSSVDPNQIFKMFFGGGGGGGMDDDFGGFSFSNMGGGGQGGHTFFSSGGGFPFSQGGSSGFGGGSSGFGTGSSGFGGGSGGFGIPLEMFFGGGAGGNRKKKK